jgi:hypothetical protein
MRHQSAGDSTGPRTSMRRASTTSISSWRTSVSFRHKGSTLSSGDLFCFTPPTRSSCYAEFGNYFFQAESLRSRNWN